MTSCYVTAMKQLAAGLLVAAAILLACGAIVGFVPASRDGSTCGSAFVPNTSAPQEADFVRLGGSVAEDACSSAQSDRRLVAWVLLGAGVVALGSGLIVKRPT